MALWVMQGVKVYVAGKSCGPMQVFHSRMSIKERVLGMYRHIATYLSVAPAARVAFSAPSWGRALGPT